jgi:hypothetical protein
MSKNRKSNQIHRANKIEKSDSLILYGLLFILTIIPLISHLATFYHISPIITASEFDTGTTNDVFITYKFVFLIMSSIFLTIVYIYKLLAKNDQIAKSYINIPIAVITVLVLLSGAFSVYKSISIWGNFSNREGTLVYLLYFLLFLIAANTQIIREKWDWFIYSLYPFVGVNLILVLLHFYGFNVLDWSFFSQLIFSTSDGISSAGNHFNSTLGNEDYLSGLGGVCTILFFVKGVYSVKLKAKCINLLFSLLSFTMVISSLARSGFLSILVMIPLVFVIAGLGPRRKVQLKSAIVAVLCFALSFMVLNHHDEQIWQRNFATLISESTSVINLSANTADTKSSTVVSSEANATENFNLPPHAWGSGTGRIYIWEKTLELIKVHPVLGYGLDSLQYIFPQDDPAKASAIWDPNVLVDKPHNMYIGLAFGTGVFTLLAFFWLIIRHIFATISLFRKELPSDQTSTLLALFSAWCVYLIQAMFNDSIIGSASIFWILFGISVSILKAENYRIDLSQKGI